MKKISGQLLISGQFQDICDNSGISWQLEPCHHATTYYLALFGQLIQEIKLKMKTAVNGQEGKCN